MHLGKRYPGTNVPPSNRRSTAAFTQRSKQRYTRQKGGTLLSLPKRRTVRLALDASFAALLLNAYAKQKFHVTFEGGQLFDRTLPHIPGGLPPEIKSRLHGKLLTNAIIMHYAGRFIAPFALTNCASMANDMVGPSVRAAAMGLRVGAVLFGTVWTQTDRLKSP